MKLLNIDEIKINNRDNVASAAFSRDRSFRDGPSSYWCSAKLESELASLSPKDQILYLKQYDLSESPLNTVIQACFSKLDLLTFLTSGEKESRAWKFRKGLNAQQCAGIIHTDFEKNFIKAEIVSYDDYVKFNGRSSAKESGKMRLEGKDYLMRDGDVVEFKVGRV